MFGQVWAFGVDIVPVRKQNKRSHFISKTVEKNVIKVIDALFKARFKMNLGDLSSLGAEKILSENHTYLIFGF